MIDNKNSSEVWGGFRVARRAKVLKSVEMDHGDKITLSASHNGYYRLKGKPTHSRQWDFLDKLLLVEDHITGKGLHDIEVIFPLHPKIHIIDTKLNEVLLEVLDKKIRLNFKGNGFLKVEKSTYHPEFGVSINNYKIIYCVTQVLPIKILTRISW